MLRPEEILASGICFALLLAFSLCIGGTRDD